MVLVEYCLSGGLRDRESYGNPFLSPYPYLPCRKLLMSQQKINHVGCRTTKKKKSKAMSLKCIKWECLKQFSFFNAVYFFNVWVYMRQCEILSCGLHVSVHAVLLEARRGHPKSWNWSYTWLWAALWVQRTELSFSETAASAPNHGTISPAPEKHTIWKEATEKYIK